MTLRSKFVVVSIAAVAAGLGGCATNPPRAMDNVCKIFEEKSRWYKAAKSAESEWGSPIPIMMSFIYQESRFESRAKPPRTKILWVIPGPRLSSAYGYSQAKDDTWDWYRRDSGHRGADRNEFRDAIDFVGWYNAQSRKRNGIAKDDAYNLYLAYHEGHGGYERRTYQGKKWLTDTARTVSSRAARYRAQLDGCRKDLEGPWWWPF
jgi:hypothetical protein